MNASMSVSIRTRVSHDVAVVVDLGASSEPVANMNIATGMGTSSNTNENFSEYLSGYVRIGESAEVGVGVSICLSMSLTASVRVGVSAGVHVVVIVGENAAVKVCVNV